MKRRLLLLLALNACAVVLWAQQILNIDLSATRQVANYNLGTFVKVTYAFPTVTPAGNDTIMHGAIAMTDSVYYGQREARGLILNHQYTLTNASGCASLNPSMSMESMLLSDKYLLYSGTGSNFIIVTTDNYGFGCSVVNKQAYLYGDITAVNALDGLLAAKQVLAALHICYGDILASVGYSQGGHSSMATLKVAESISKYQQLKFDCVICGAGPYDLDEIYNIYFTPGAYVKYPVALPLIFSNITAIEQMKGNPAFATYSDADLYDAPLARNIARWYNGQLHGDEINQQIFSLYGATDSVKVALLASPTLADSTTTLARAYRQVIHRNSLNHSWQPSTRTKIYLFHYLNDEVVPVECTYNMAKFLRSCGLTDRNLQTIIYQPSDIERQYHITTHGAIGAPFIHYASSILLGIKQ